MLLCLFPIVSRAISRNCQLLSGKYLICVKSSTNHLSKKVVKLEKENNNVLITEDKPLSKIDKRLSKENFTSIIEKQDEINKIINDQDNIYCLYYLIDKHSTFFNSNNFFNLINKISFLNHTNCINSNLAPIIIPSKIKDIIAKSIIQVGPNLTVEKCEKIFEKLNSLNIKLEDHACKEILNLLERRLHHLDLKSLIRIKIKVDEMRDESLKKYKLKQLQLDYVESFEKCLNLVVEFKCYNIEDPYLALNVLKYFSSSLSPNKYIKIVEFINDNISFREAYGFCKTLSNFEPENAEFFSIIKNITIKEMDIMNNRNQNELNLNEIISFFIINEKLSNMDNKKSSSDMIFLENLLNFNFENLKKNKKKIQDKNFLNKLTKDLLKTCLLSRIYAPEILKFFYENCLAEKNNTQVDGFYFDYFINCLSLIPSNEAKQSIGVKDQDYQYLVEQCLKSNIHSDNRKFTLIRSLNMLGQDDLAKILADNISKPNRLELFQRVYLRDMFQMDIVNSNERIAIKKSEIRVMFEKVLTPLTSEFTSCKEENDSLNYFIDYKVVDKKSNKRYSIFPKNKSMINFIKLISNIERLNILFTEHFDKFINSKQYSQHYFFKLNKVLTMDSSNVWIIDNDKIKYIKFNAETAVYFEQHYQNALENPNRFYLTN